MKIPFLISWQFWSKQYSFCDLPPLGSLHAASSTCLSWSGTQAACRACTEAAGVGAACSSCPRPARVGAICRYGGGRFVGLIWLVIWPVDQFHATFDMPGVLYPKRRLWMISKCLWKKLYVVNLINLINPSPHPQLWNQQLCCRQKWGQDSTAVTI